jgi:hypothetical protein
MAVPTGSLTTLAIVKDELSITASTYDTYLERLIGAATAYVTSFCKRTFHYEAAIIEKVAGFGTSYLCLSRAPVLTITSITYDGATINSADYAIDGDGASGLVYSPSSWAWSTVSGQGSSRFLYGF